MVARFSMNEFEDTEGAGEMHPAIIVALDQFAIEALQERFMAIRIVLAGIDEPAETERHITTAITNRRGAPEYRDAWSIKPWLLIVGDLSESAIEAVPSWLGPLIDGVQTGNELTVQLLLRAATSPGAESVAQRDRLAGLLAAIERIAPNLEPRLLGVTLLPDRNGAGHGFSRDTNLEQARNLLDYLVDPCTLVVSPLASEFRWPNIPGASLAESWTEWAMVSAASLAVQRYRDDSAAAGRALIAVGLRDAVMTQPDNAWHPNAPELPATASPMSNESSAPTPPPSPLDLRSPRVELEKTARQLIARWRNDSSQWRQDQLSSVNVRGNRLASALALDKQAYLDQLKRQLNGELARREHPGLVPIVERVAAAQTGVISRAKRPVQPSFDLDVPDPSSVMDKAADAVEAAIRQRPKFHVVVGSAISAIAAGTALLDFALRSALPDAVTAAPFPIAFIAVLVTVVATVALHLARTQKRLDAVWKRAVTQPASAWQRQANAAVHDWIQVHFDEQRSQLIEFAEATVKGVVERCSNLVSVFDAVAISSSSTGDAPFDGALFVQEMRQSKSFVNWLIGESDEDPEVIADQWIALATPPRRAAIDHDKEDRMVTELIERRAAFTRDAHHAITILPRPAMETRRETVNVVIAPRNVCGRLANGVQKHLLPGGVEGQIAFATVVRGLTPAEVFGSQPVNGDA